MSRKKSFELINKEDLESDSPIRWQECFICQREIEERVQNPKERKGYNPQNSSYHTIAHNLVQFSSINELPPNLQKRCSSFDEQSLSEYLVKNNGVFHKSCISMFNKQKLDRKRKARHDQLEDQQDGEPSSQFEEIPAKIGKSSRKSGETQRFSSSCIFCEKIDDNKYLHQCETLELSERIKKTAESLNEFNLIAKLSEGDMVAIEAKYHLKCLSAFTRRGKKIKQQELSQSKDNNEIIQGMALSHIITVIEEKINAAENNIPVFMMKDLRQVYQEALARLDASDDMIKNVNVSRLKDDILEEIPALCEQKSGKYMLLTLQKDCGKALFKATQNSLKDDGIVLAKASKIIRKYLFEKEEVFDGDLSKAKQEQSVPPALLHLISLIMDGHTTFDDASGDAKAISLNIAQIIQFNAVKHKRKESASIRHSKNNEPPFPVKTGLLIHAKTRKKSLINSLAADGISITYKRVQEIENQFTSQLCELYNKKGLVYPIHFQEGSFITAAIDNIDHDPTSSTAKTSFHGTSISVYQRTKLGDSERSFHFQRQNHQEQGFQLPESYTDIKPSKSFKPEYPSNEAPINESFPTCQGIYYDAKEWLQNVQCQLEHKLPVSFSSFHSKKYASDTQRNHRISLLPLLPESINSYAVVRHCMIVIAAIVQHFNPGQNAVITADQPVYAMGKQVQWMYPEQFENFVWFMGPLHIEMAFINAIGDWLEGSGWIEVFKKTKMTTPGRVESFLTASNVKRSRYAHQVSLASLLHLANLAFRKQDEFNNYEDWRIELEKRSVNACYWFNVIDMEVNLFMFIKSLRVGDFDLFVRSLKEIIPWMFSLDHINYSRWLPVFLIDMLSLPTRNETVFKHFSKGEFTVKKTSRVFSNMGIDQAHEQCNKVIKIEGGAIGILDNPSTLTKWAVAGPVISDLIIESEFEAQAKLPSPHHEDKKRFEETFIKDRNEFTKEFLGASNPFELSGENLIHIVSKQVLEEKASASVRNAKALGKHQMQDFMTQRLQSKKVSLYNTIKKNNLALFRQKQTMLIKSTKQKVVSLAAERRLYASLYVACQTRDGDLENFFCHENHLYPVSLSEYGKLRKCSNKSDFLKILDELNEAETTPPKVEMKVIDGAAFVNMNQPKFSKTYGEFCEKEIANKIKQIAEGLTRLDIVFDVYKQCSIKSDTRQNRGTGIRVIVEENTPIHTKFQEFMRCDENKNELFQLIADAITTFDSDVKIIATKLENISANTEVDTTELQPCNHEEADSRIILHLQDASRNGIKDVTVCTVDTDIVVLLIHHYHHFNFNYLWVEMGVGQHKRWLPVHSYVKSLDPLMCRALPFWYAVTGCDTVSMFSGRGKKTAWKIWKMYPDSTEAFARLATTQQITDTDMEKVEKFVIMLYDKTCDFTTVNECRRYLFTKKGCGVESIPPTYGALEQHVKRALLQCSIWCNASRKLLPEMNINDWGWEVENGCIKPFWTKLADASKACRELIKCGCKKNCSSRCKCKNSDLPCTELCECGGGCG